MANKDACLLAYTIPNFDSFEGRSTTFSVPIICQILHGWDSHLSLQRIVPSGAKNPF